ncbi:MAG: hypothetical protein OXI67_02265 [Candidatus Poribacteria bacterium]|nr:hypothetical protein [Candidatus Poribacteria bacterium]
MKKIKLSFWISVFICCFILAGGFQFALAQFQSEFGQELLLEPEPPKTDPAKLIIDAHISNTFNNHIELGLSVDPYTSSLAGQESPQLEGIINRLGVNLRGELPIVGDKLRLKLQYAPQLENYNGKEGKLNEFDAFTDVSSTELSFRPVSDLPEFIASHQFQRLTRTLNVYNNTERQISLRFGRVLEYNLRIHRFDDESQLREDFLLIGSTNHKATTRLQFGLPKQMLGKVEYGIEHGRYQTNLNNLILGVTGLEDGERRLDWRHSGTAKLLQTAAERIVFQEEVNLFLNRSNVDFFNFVSAEAALSTFYRFDTSRWIRLRFSRVWVRFEGRQILDEMGNIMENAENRSDTQWSLGAQVNWKFTSYLTLNADYQFTQNRTNELDPILDFLNYNHSIVSLTLRGNY